MGSAADEIDRKIKETRDQIDENLGTLEHRGTSGAVRYGRIAAITLGVVVVAGAGFLVYRRIRRRSRTEQLQRTLIDMLKNLPDTVKNLPDSVGDARHEVASRLKKGLPSVKVIVNGGDEAREPGTLASIVRKVAPAVVGTASSAVLDRLTRTPDGDRSRTTPAEHN